MGQRTRLSTPVIKEILLLSQRGNSAESISDFTGVSLKQVQKVLKNNGIKIPDYLKTPHQERRERIEEFVRIVKDKSSHNEIGRELYENMKKRHKHYRESWIADSTVEFTFKQNTYIGISIITDFHLGHEGVDYERLEHDIKIIGQTPNMYMVFLGDSMDNFIEPLKYPEALINAITSPKDQAYMLNYVLSILKKPDNKILLVTKDNHVTERLKRTSGIDWTNKMWSDLNVFYGGEEVIASLKVGRILYKMLCRHRYRGTSRIHLTAACKTLLKNGKYDDADIVALGHMHEGAMEVFHYRGIPRVACQASTYKLFDPFAKKCGFEDPNIFMPCLILNPYVKDYTVCTSVDQGAYTLKALNQGHRQPKS